MRYFHYRKFYEPIKRTNLYFIFFQLPVADPFLEKVNLSDLGELDKSLINYLIKRYFMTWSFGEIKDGRIGKGI